MGIGSGSPSDRIVASVRHCSATRAIRVVFAAASVSSVAGGAGVLLDLAQAITVPAVKSAVMTTEA